MTRMRPYRSQIALHNNNAVSYDYPVSSLPSLRAYVPYVTIPALVSLDGGFVPREEKYKCIARIMNLKNPFKWCYPACPMCFRRVNQSRLATTCTFTSCIFHGQVVEPIPWYRICIEVTDGLAWAEFIAFGRPAKYIVGNQARNVLQSHGAHPYIVPELILNIIGKQFTFLVSLKQDETNMSATEYIASHVGPSPPKFELFSWRNRISANMYAEQNYQQHHLHSDTEVGSSNSRAFSANNNIEQHHISSLPPFI